MKRTAGEIGKAVEARVIGDDAEISGLASIANAAPGDLVFRRGKASRFRAGIEGFRHHHRKVCGKRKDTEDSPDF